MSSLVSSAQRNERVANGFGGRGRWFESWYPDQYLHESDLHGVALFFWLTGFLRAILGLQDFTFSLSFSITCILVMSPVSDIVSFAECKPNKQPCEQWSLYCCRSECLVAFLLFFLCRLINHRVNNRRIFCLKVIRAFFCHGNGVGYCHNSGRLWSVNDYHISLET